MLKNEKIEIVVNPNSRSYYINLGYKCNNYDKLEINTLDLPKGSNILIECICDICNKESKPLKYNMYYKNTRGNTIEFTCRKCSSIKSKRTKLERYGDENYRDKEKTKRTKLERYGNENYSNREKSKKTCLEKYGVENVSSLDSVKESKKITSIRNWGVDNVFKSEDIKEKIKDKVISKYGSEYYVISDDMKKKYKDFCTNMGVDHYSKSDEYKLKFENTCFERFGYKTNLINPENIEKVKQTNLLRYGVENAMKNKEVSLYNTSISIENRKKYFKNLGYDVISYDYDKSIYELRKIECNHIFKIDHDLFRSRIKYKNSCCLVCYPKDELTSIKENELGNWIKSLIKSEVILNDRKTIGKEIDIYLPEYKLGIEFNGLYWHSDAFKNKTYHLEKTKKCNDLGIDLIHIWEDDWNYRKEIIKSIIKNKLNIIDNKIFARKCKISIISNKEAKIFLNNNHIQGYTNSSICISLKYNDEIVSLMTFGKRNTNGSSKYELIRFCNKINTSVVGAASKLFKYFISNYKYDNILSYSDKSIFNGDLYERLGFENNGDTQLNYYWTDLNIKYHRFNFNKKRLVKMGYDKNKTEDEIMKSIGFYKIWSCGQVRWIYS